MKLKTHEYAVRNILERYKVSQSLIEEAVDGTKYVDEKAMAVRDGVLYDNDCSGFHYHRPNKEGLKKLKKGLIEARCNLLNGKNERGFWWLGNAMHYICDCSTWAHYADVSGDETAHSQYEEKLDDLNRNEGRKISRDISALASEPMNSEKDIDKMLEVFSEIGWRADRNSPPEPVKDLALAYRWMHTVTIGVLDEPDLPERYWNEAEKTYREEYSDSDRDFYRSLLFILPALFFFFAGYFIITAGFGVIIFYLGKVERWGHKICLHRANTIFVSMENNGVKGLVLTPAEGWYRMPTELRKKILL